MKNFGGSLLRVLPTLPLGNEREEALPPVSSLSFIIICPDCGKNQHHEYRCPKCGGDSWVPAGHAGGVTEQLEKRRVAAELEAGGGSAEGESNDEEVMPLKK